MIHVGVDARRRVRAARKFGRLVSWGCSLVLAANVGKGWLSCGAHVADLGRVSKVGIDTNTSAAAIKLGVVYNNVALIRLVTVAARAVEFAKVARIEVGDGDSSGTIVLEDLVLCVESTTTDNIRNVTGAGLLEGSSILAYVLPPNIDELTWSTTVDTLSLVSTNDHVGDSCSRFENEHGICFTCL